MAAFADSWMKQAGFPYIVVENIGYGRYWLWQERYRVRRREQDLEAANDQVW